MSFIIIPTFIEENKGGKSFREDLVELLEKSEYGSLCQCNQQIMTYIRRI